MDPILGSRQVENLLPFLKFKLVGTYHGCPLALTRSEVRFEPLGLVMVERCFIRDEVRFQDSPECSK